MQGIPIDCVSTAEICEWIFENPLLARSVVSHFTANNPKAVAELRETYEDQNFTDSDGNTWQPSSDFDSALCYKAVSNYVFQAVKKGQITLQYRESGSSERFRFDASLFDDNFGPSDIALGTPPLWNAEQFDGYSLFAPRDEAITWLQSIPLIPQNYSMPHGFVVMEYLVNRLIKYCVAKKDIAEGVVIPGTDSFGNWVNSSDEFAGRLQAQNIPPHISGG